MTRLLPDDACSRCESLLIPPQLAVGMKIPATADYVCLKCGRAYKWEGHPPTLKILVAVAPEADDEEDENG